MKVFLIIVLILLFSALNYSSVIPDSTIIYGVTIDAVDHLDDITDALSHHSKKMSTRIIFDEWIPAKEYIIPCKKIHDVSYVMGEILDSYYFSEYSNNLYTDRVNEYTEALGDYVDIWEIGNEVNGEWLGNIDSVINKVISAYNVVKDKNKKTALTLYYNHDCWDIPENEMFFWVNNKLPLNIRNEIDYLLVSYYEDDCNGYQPDWQQVFDSLHTLFPYSRLGIGECGTKYNFKKAEYIKKYYSINITTPNYIGGYFWWYYKEDCIPSTKPLWEILNNSLGIH